MPPPHDTRQISFYHAAHAAAAVGAVRAARAATAADSNDTCDAARAAAVRCVSRFVQAHPALGYLATAALAAAGEANVWADCRLWHVLPPKVKRAAKGNAAEPHAAASSSFDPTEVLGIAVVCVSGALARHLCAVGDVDEAVRIAGPAAVLPAREGYVADVAVLTAGGGLYLWLPHGPAWVAAACARSGVPVPLSHRHAAAARVAVTVSDDGDIDAAQQDTKRARAEVAAAVGMAPSGGATTPSPGADDDVPTATAEGAGRNAVEPILAVRCRGGFVETALGFALSGQVR